MVTTYTFDADGTARDPQTGAEVAWFADDGDILSSRTGAGRRLGRVNGDGSVYADNGQMLGRVNSDGTVWDTANQVGFVSPPHVHRQGALMLLL